MTTDDRRMEIDHKCRTAGCTEERARKHSQLFVYERWDVHPPEDFKAWHKTQTCTLREPRGTNPVPAWNSDRDRQEFYKSKGEL